MLMLLAIPACAILGFQFGYRWGFWQGCLGAVLGGVLAVPLVGIFFAVMVALASFVERVRRR
jgi:hypothetical protein